MSPRKRHTVLVVDDEPDVVMSVKDLLRLEHRVLGAHSAAEGMKILAQEEVHVVMTDQRMPEITGVEFLRQIRGDHPEAIRLLFTGYADIRAVIDAINQGNVFRYITKPWDPDELMSIIREAISRYDLIIERKRLVEELQHKNTELALSNREMERVKALQEAFVQVASHELRTPLTLILGISYLAAHCPNVPPPLKDWLGRMERAGQRLQRLVDQLINQLAAGQFERPLLRAPVDLAGLLTEAADDVRPFTEERHQTLVLDAQADLGTLPLERERIGDALDNLLMNAVKFTPDGGQLMLFARRAPGAVEIRVSDTGIGIPEEHFPLLFRPFYTGLDPLHHRSGEFEFGTRGIGLGLSLTQQIVEQHGGTVTVASTLGQGSTFTVMLPVAAADGLR